MHLFNYLKLAVILSNHNEMVMKHYKGVKTYNALQLHDALCLDVLSKVLQTHTVNIYLKRVPQVAGSWLV